MIRPLIVGVLACCWMVLLGGSHPALAQEPPEPVEAQEKETSPSNEKNGNTEETSVSEVKLEEGAPPEPVEEPSSSDEQGPANSPAEEKPAQTPPAESPVSKEPPAETPPTDKHDETLDATALAELRRTGPRKLLEIVGIDESNMRHIRDGWPLSDDEQEVTLKLMYRVRRFGLQETAQWTDPKPPLADMAMDPDKYRLQMFQLRGRVEQVIEEEPPVEVMQRYDLKKYYACQVELEGSKQPVLIVTPTIPSQWNLELQLNEPVSAQGLFLKVGETRGEHSQLVFLAGRLAWHPDTVREHLGERSVSLGMTELGRLGMDVGLFDQVDNQNRITEKDREAFYQALAAVGRAPQNQLARIAYSHLSEMQEIWQVEQRQAETTLAEKKKELQAQGLSEEEKKKLTLEIKKAKSRASVLKKAEQEAGEGRFSVFPLFNLAEEQHGRLVLLQGVVKRVVKIEMSNPRKPDSNRDIIDRFGIDHYYEIAVFTKDSNDNPIIVCVRELPQGFPTGESVNEAVQIAGFFFKTWAFYTTAGVTAEGEAVPVPRRKLAPLLIARSPIWIQPEDQVSDSNVGYIIGGVFMALSLLAVISVWRFNKGSEEFRKDVIVRKYDVDSGISLNDVGLETVDGPDFSHLKDEDIPEGSSESTTSDSDSSASPESGSEEEQENKPPGDA